jgi:S1-C subfamily serine protease
MILRFALSVASVLALGWNVSAVGAEPKISAQEGVLRAKPGVVLVIAEVGSEVTLDCGAGPTTVKPIPFKETGTGWFIDSHGWIITNGHVVQPAYETPKWLINQQAQRAVTTACLPKALERAGITPGSSPDAEDALKRKLLDRVLPTAKVTLLPSISVLASNGSRVKAEVKKYSPPVSAAAGEMSGRDLALLKTNDDNYPVLGLADSKVVQIGDPIYIIGFPGVVLSHELLNQSASMEASVTRGAVSGFKQDRANNPVLQTDAAAAWGNSGGPAVNDRGQVVGVLTFVSLAPGPEGSIVQGFNFVIPSEAVRNFIGGTAVSLLAVGKFSPIWDEGLRSFFSGDYKDSERQFEQADKILPGLPDLKRMLDEARDKVKNPPPRPFPWFWVAIAVTLLSGGGYGAQFYVRWQRNRYRIRPDEIIRLQNEGKQPTILDVRKADHFDKLPLQIPNSVRLSPEELESGIAGLELDPARPIVAYCT